MSPDWAADSISNRQVTNLRVGMKNYRKYSDYQLDTTGSGHSIPVLGLGDLEVALKFELAENPGKVNTIMVHPQRRSSCTPSSH